MFFLLSKILWFLLQPSSLMFAALMAGVLLAATAWRRLSRWLIAGSIGGLLVVGLLPVGDILTRPLENRFSRPDAGVVDAVEGIIVLGGAEDRSASGREELAGLNGAAERYTEVVALTRRYPGVQVVFTGGSSAVVADLPPEADTARRVLEALGVDSKRILLESKARNTHENAEFTAHMLKPGPGRRWLLVTSAMHMPRAVGCFRRAGFNVVPWPVDYRTSRHVDFTLNSSMPGGLGSLDAVAREYIGLFIYYLTGRTDALLPGP